MSRNMTNSEAIANLNHIYGFVSPNIQRSLDVAFKALEKQPQGEWIAREDMDYLDENKVVHKHFECNKCGLVHDFIDGHTSQYNFCPNCGVKMKGGADMQKPNCVRCDHFGKCEGCEKGDEE